MAKHRSNETNPEGTSGKKNRTLVSIFAVPLVVIISVALIFSLVPRGGFSVEDYALGRYAGNKIIPEKDQVFQNNVKQIAESNPGAELYTKWREAYYNTIMYYAALDLAETSGMAVSEERIGEIIHNEFTNEEGEFRQEEFEALPAARLQDYKESIRNNIFISRVMEDINPQRRLKHSSNETLFLKSLILPQRKISFTAWGAEDFPVEELEMFLEENPSLFERRIFQRINITTDVDPETLAAEIHEKLQSDLATFETYTEPEYADKVSVDLNENGNYLYAHMLENSLSADDVNELMGLDTGEFSNVLSSRSGYVIYQADSEIVRPDINEEGTQSAIKTYMRSNEAGRIQSYLIRKAEAFKEGIGESGFAEAASKQDKTVFETGYFPINYGAEQFLPSLSSSTVHGSLNNIADDKDFYKRVFSLEIGDVSEPYVITGNSRYDIGTIVLIKLEDERKVSEQSDIDSVYESYWQNLPQSKKQDIFTRMQPQYASYIQQFGISMFQDMIDTITPESFFEYLASKQVGNDIEAFAFGSPKHENNFESKFNKLFTRQ